MTYTALPAVFTNELADAALVQTWLDAINAANAAMPGGFMAPFSGASAPTGWALLNGGTITTASTLYPETWANTPASWHSGTSLVLPDARGKALFMADGSAFVLGATSGANAKSIATGNLPAHAHGLGSHTHTATGTAVAAHSHPLSTNGFTQTAAAHSHVAQEGGGIVMEGTGALPGAGVQTGGGGYAKGRTSDAGGHGHYLSGNTDSAGGFTPTVTIGAATGTTDNAGSGTALDVTPANLAVNYMIRLR